MGTFIQISWVNQSGPAHAAGLREGDAIHAINGVSCNHKSNPEIVNLITSAGDVVTMLVGDAAESERIAMMPKTPERVALNRTPEGVGSHMRNAAPTAAPATTSRGARPAEGQSARANKLSSVLKRIPHRVAAAPSMTSNQSSVTAESKSSTVGANPSSLVTTAAGVGGATASSQRGAQANQSKRVVVVAGPGARRASEAASRRSSDAVSPAAKRRSDAGMSDKKKVWHAGPAKEHTKSIVPTSDLFSYVPPLSRGVAYDMECDKVKHQNASAFWEQGPPAPTKPLSEERKRLRESRDKLNAQVNKSAMHGCE